MKKSFLSPTCLLYSALILPLIEFVCFRFLVHSVFKIKIGWGNLMVDSDLIVPLLFSFFIFCYFSTKESLPHIQLNTRWFIANLFFVIVFLILNSCFATGLLESEELFLSAWWFLACLSLFSAFFIYISFTYFFNMKKVGLILTCILMATSTIFGKHFFTSAWNQLAPSVSSLSCRLSSILIGENVTCKVLLNREGISVLRMSTPRYLAFVGKPCAGLDGILFFNCLAILVGYHFRKALNFSAYIAFSGIGLCTIYLLNILRISATFSALVYLRYHFYPSFEFFQGVIHSNAGWIVYFVFGLFYFKLLLPRLSFCWKISQEEVSKADSLKYLSARHVVPLILLTLVGSSAQAQSFSNLLNEMKKEYPGEYKRLGPKLFSDVLSELVKGDWYKDEVDANNSSQICQGRLTLTSATPVTTSDVTGATTVYFTPYLGAGISLYSGTAWQIVTFTEASVSVPATTATPFDVFGYNNSGTLTLETVNWTNATTRATALTTQNGVYVKTGATTRRYLGTGYTTGVSGQIEDSTAKRYLWNACNRMDRWMKVIDTTDSWTYTTATWRQARATSTNKVEFVLGLAEDLITAKTLNYTWKGGTGGYVSVGVGVDSTSSNSATINGTWSGNSGNQNIALYSGVPAVGYHYLAWLEISQATGTTTWYGDAGKTYLQGGMIAEGKF